LLPSPARRRIIDTMIPEFQWLIDHHGWTALERLPNDQGLDVRDRIAKDGIIFSAYVIPRGEVGRVGEVDSDPPPSWAQSTGEYCTVSARELAEILEIAAPEDEYFRALSARLGEVKAYILGPRFARSRLNRELDMLHLKYEAHRDVLRSWRSEIGLVRMVKGIFESYGMERRQRARLRRALDSLAGN
jgi:hypothetical protein